MKDPIRKAVVIGAGTMGAQIAAHLANAHVETWLLDIVPNELTDKEKKAGLSLDDEKVRNRLARQGLQSALKASPAAFFTEEKKAWISIGNLDDDLDIVSEVDWVLEAVVENLKIKQNLMAQIEDLRGENTIVSTNTSGIPINQIVQGRGESFGKHFLGTHFFNPPRYLKLLEIIPAEKTDPAVIDRIERFAKTRSGKGVVHCKDTPNFIANRLGSVGGAFVLDYALEHGYTVEEVDALTGPILGRPKTATFRLLDLVGLDVASHVRQNLAEALPEDEAVQYLESAQAANVTDTMLARGWLGNKAGQGFYKKVVEEGGKSFWPLNLQTLEHEPPQKPRFESVGKAKDKDTVPEKVEKMLAADDRGGQLVRAVIFNSLSYASKRIPEIADTPKSIDDAIRWGFQHEMGPFELWDKLGVAETLEKMEEAGYPVTDWVKTMLEKDIETFYRYEGVQAVGVYNPEQGEYENLPVATSQINLSAQKAELGTLESNDGASLIDLGDGVACLEVHNRGNTFDEDVFVIMDKALHWLEDGGTGLVIGNESDNFSLGANLFTVAVAAQNELWDQLEEAVRTFQELNMRLRHASKPVVVAPAGMALGGGAELTMHAARVVAAAESYIGLVEVGVGVVPAGGGCKEILRRVVNPVMQVENGDVLPPLQKIFEFVGQGEVARSAEAARKAGFLDACDRVVMNRSQLLVEAKREVLHLAPMYRPPQPEQIFAAGRDVYAALKVAVFSYLESGYLSEYDAHIGRTLGRVLTGGNLSQPQWVDPWYILDLEREAFLSLCGEEKTQARMWHMLQEGKPLRN